MPALIFLAAAVVAPGTLFSCTPTAVWDGDEPIWCAEGPHVRVAGVAARESDETCRSNQPCPDASAIAAKTTLTNLVGVQTGTNSTGHFLVKGPTMRCLSDGGAGGNRTAAWCVSPRGGDISCAMVASGKAIRWDRYWRNHRCG